jgi:hypothetical protein
MKRHDDWITELYIKETINMEQVRAKFKVTNVGPSQSNDGHRIDLWAVYGGSPENEVFFKYTPSGQISLQIVTDETAKFFEVGKEFYVDFTKAE